MISVDTPVGIHIEQMLLRHRDSAQNLRLILDPILEPLVEEDKLGLVMDLLVAAPVLGVFGQVQLQVDFSVICLEIEGKMK